jgi:hypothetical protein
MGRWLLGVLKNGAWCDATYTPVEAGSGEACTTSSAHTQVMLLVSCCAAAAAALTYAVCCAACCEQCVEHAAAVEDAHQLVARSLSAAVAGITRQCTMRNRRRLATHILLAQSQTPTNCIGFTVRC